jgi:hypothetical protein
MDELIKITSQTTPELFGPSPRYFITLGMAIVNNIFRQDLHKEDPDAVRIVLRLSDREKNQITNLANNPKFIAAADNFSSIWDDACNDLLYYRPGHLHPLGLSVGGWKSGKDTPSSTSGQYATSSAG